MNVLVTGGFGFIGSHLVECLLNDDDVNVHVVDDLSSNAVSVNSYVNRIGKSDRLSYDIMKIREFCANTNRHFDEIYHLASVVGPVGVLNYAGKIVEYIVNDTYALVDLALKNNSKLCDISTSEVYGGGRSGYCVETDQKIIPPVNSVRLEYAIAKLACEVALLNSFKVAGLNVVIIRPFNVAGPRQMPKGGFVIPRFVHQAMNNQPITVYNNGSAVRAFTHVVDIVKGIKSSLRNGKCGEIYNLGNPANKTTVLELAHRVLNIVDSKSEIIFVDPKKLFGPLFEEANDKYPDSSKAENELNWVPSYNLDETILDAYEYIRSEQNG